jgi:hypothetical protein
VRTKSGLEFGSSSLSRQCFWLWSQARAASRLDAGRKQFFSQSGVKPARNSTLTGSFSNVASGSRLNVFGGSFQVNYGSNDVVLGNYLSSSPVPEPSRALLIILGLSGVMLRRRRAVKA